MEKQIKNYLKFFVQKDSVFNRTHVFLTYNSKNYSTLQRRIIKKEFQDFSEVDQQKNLYVQKVFKHNLQQQMIFFNQIDTSEEMYFQLSLSQFIKLTLNHQNQLQFFILIQEEELESDKCMEFLNLINQTFGNNKKVMKNVFIIMLDSIKSLNGANPKKQISKFENLQTIREAKILRFSDRNFQEDFEFLIYENNLFERKNFQFKNYFPQKYIKEFEIDIDNLRQQKYTEPENFRKVYWILKEFEHNQEIRDIRKQNFKYFQKEVDKLQLYNFYKEKTPAEKLVLKSKQLIRENQYGFPVDHEKIKEEKNYVQKKFDSALGRVFMWIITKIISWMIFISPFYRGYQVIKKVQYYMSWLLWAVGCFKKKQQNDQEELEKQLLQKRRIKIQQLPALKNLGDQQGIHQFNLYEQLQKFNYLSEQSHLIYPIMMNILYSFFLPTNL